MGKKLSLNQPVKKPTNKEDKLRFEAVMGSGQLLCRSDSTCYDIMPTINQVSRARPNLSKNLMVAVSCLFRYLAGMTDFVIT